MFMMPGIRALHRAADPADRHPLPAVTPCRHRTTRPPLSIALERAKEPTDDHRDHRQRDEHDRGDHRTRPTSTTSKPSCRSSAIEEPDGRHVVHSDYDSIFTWDYEKGARPKLNKLYEKAKKAQWNGETDLPWDTEVDQEQLVLAQAEATGGFGAGFDLTGTPVEKLGRQGVVAVRHREPELDAVPVPPRRAGRAHLHGQDRRVGAVDRRQVLRLDPGDGRGPPRRGVRQVPRREALGPLPDQRPPRPAARRHHPATRAGT